MAKRKILILGGTGFLGRQFLKMVGETDDTFFVITRQTTFSSSKNIHYLEADLSSKEALKNIANTIADVDVLIDLAARIPSKKNDESFNDFLDDNFNFHVHLLPFCPNIKKIIYASTIDVYGALHNFPFTENHPTFPTTDYGATKLFLEHYYRLFCQRQSIDLVILRFTQIYGPNEAPIKVIPIFVDRILTNKSIKVIGTGEDLRRYIYIDDAAYSIQLALKHNIQGIYNVASDEIVSLNQLIEVLKEVSNKDFEVERVNGNPPKHYYMDNTKIKEALHFSPKFSLKQGLEEVLKLNKKC